MSEQAINPEFYDILETCLDAVLKGTASLDECLERYPQYADLLKPDLQAALLTSKLKSPRMSGAAVSRLEARLVAQIPKADRTPSAKPITGKVIQFNAARPARSLGRIAAVLVVAFLIALGSGGGVVAAASDDVPGESLYSIKRLWERVVVVVASVTGQLDEAWLRLAQTRLDEVLAMAERGWTLTPDLLSDWQTATQNALAYNGEDDAELAAYLQTAQAALDNPAITWPDATAPDNLRLLIEPAMISPQPDSTPNAAPTATMTATPTVTLSPTPLPPTQAPAVVPGTVAPTTTPLPPSATPRSLIPATPTRTPTLTLTPSASPFPTRTTEPTWTPLPPLVLPTRPGTTQIVQPTVPPGQVIVPSATIWYPYLRLTEESFYLTRTAVGLPTVVPEGTP